MAVAPTPVAAAPDAPDRAQRATFSARATAFFDWIKNTFVAGVNALASNVYANAQDAASSAANAVAQSASATAQAGIATAQAAAATSAAATATTQAGVATTQAASITTAAATSTAKADVATAKAAEATAAAATATAVTLGVATGQPVARPTLNLAFAHSRTVDPRVTFTRASAATRFSARGLIETVASGAPRIDYDPVSLACRGLLIEEQRTNLLAYSQDFDNGAWNKTRATVAANATTAPDGTITADKLVEDSSANTSHYLFSTFSASAQTYTFSVYLKDAGRSWAKLVLSTGSSGAMFNLATGAKGVVSDGYTSDITPAGNGWYRCSVTTTATAATWYAEVDIGEADNDIGYTGGGTSGIYIWGAQLEAGAFPTSYIPTTASQVTRAADVATMTGANFSSWYRQDEGSFVATCDTTFTASNYPFIAALYGGGSDYTALLGSGAGTQGRCEVLVGGAVQAAFNGASVGGSGVVFSESAAYKVNDFMFAQNGTLGTADTSGTVPTATALHIGHLNSSGFANGHIRSLRYYPKRLANAELQTLTQG
jgi:hypothetical protein